MAMKRNKKNKKKVSDETIGEACIDPGLLKREPLFVEAVIDFKTGKLLWTEPYDFSRLNGIGERFIRKAVIYKVVDVEVIEGKSVTLIEYTVTIVSSAWGALILSSAGS